MPFHFVLSNPRTFVRSLVSGVGRTVRCFSKPGCHEKALTGRGVQSGQPVGDVHQVVGDSATVAKQGAPDEGGGSDAAFPKGELCTAQGPVEASVPMRAPGTGPVVAGKHDDGVVQHAGVTEGFHYHSHGLVQRVQHTYVNYSGTSI